MKNVYTGSTTEVAAQNRGWVLGEFKNSPWLRPAGMQLKYDIAQAGLSRSREDASADPHYWTLQMVVSGCVITSFPGKTKDEDEHITVGPNEYCLWGPEVVHYWRVVETGLILTLRWLDTPE